MTMEFKGPAEAGESVGAGADATVPAVWPKFSVARLPRIMFGSGTSGELGAVVREFGRKVLVVVRGPAFIASPAWARLRAGLELTGVEVALESVSGEPSPADRKGVRGPPPAKGPGP